MYFVCAAVASHLSWIHVLLGLAVITGLFVRILAEEQLIVKQYPEYASYAAKTKRIIPFIF
jgi:protein-S-isoprenylcysteine O-methyltransferase Ste14